MPAAARGSGSVPLIAGWALLALALAALAFDSALGIALPRAVVALAAIAGSAILLALGLRAHAARFAEPDIAKFNAAAPTSPLAVEELRHEIERYRALEKQLTQAKQEAEAAAMAKGEFLATVSHEIRTPLNGIIPLLALLKETRLDRDQTEWVGTAQQSARQLLAIVDDILDYSKIEAGKLELEAVDLRPGEIVEQVGRMMASLAEAKRLRFSLKVDPSATMIVRGDPVRLRQVLTNLVSNAIKFSERGEVAIEVSRVSETRGRAEIQFVVKDTGPGISAQAQQRLFKAFSQADASTTRVHGGTGLGLAICRRLVDLMGGQIGVRSEVGRGSAFWVRVPLAKAKAPGAVRTDLDGLRAMLVSNDAELGARIQRTLGSFGMSALVHNQTLDVLGNLRGAAAMGPSWLFDFLLLDAGTLGQQTMSLAKMVLRDDALRTLLVIVLNGEARLRDELRDPRVVVLARESADKALRDGLLRLAESDGEAMPEVAREASPQLLAAQARPHPTPPPAAPTAAPVARPAAAPRAPVPAGTPRVLLVEDNPVNRQLAQKLLELDGFSVDVAENGEVALAALKRARYGLVIMDCQMPVLDGYAASRRIRELEADGAMPGRLPIMAMTANAMLGDREKCLAAGMDDYLTKPLDRALLRGRVRHHLKLDAPGLAATPAQPLPQPPIQSSMAATPRAGEPRPAKTPAIDQAVLRDLLDVMGASLAELVRVYLEDAPRLIAELTAAAQRDDLEGLIAPAHSLKSASANLGAVKLADHARTIEHGARLKTLNPPFTPLVEQLAAEYARVAVELDRALAATA